MRPSWRAPRRASGGPQKGHQEGLLGPQEGHRRASGGPEEGAQEGLRRASGGPQEGPLGPGGPGWSAPARVHPGAPATRVHPGAPGPAKLAPRPGRPRAGKAPARSKQPGAARRIALRGLLGLGQRDGPLGRPPEACRGLPNLT